MAEVSNIETYIYHINNNAEWEIRTLKSMGEKITDKIISNKAI